MQCWNTLPRDWTQSATNSSDIAAAIAAFDKQLSRVLTPSAMVSCEQRENYSSAGRSIGSVRCIIIPIDGDCALGFRCIEFTSCSMADGQFASLICSQLKIGLAHRGSKTSGRKCDLLQILYDD